VVVHVLVIQFSSSPDSGQRKEFESMSLSASTRHWLAATNIKELIRSTKE
jgi:hypothetical protein